VKGASQGTTPLIMRQTPGSVQRAQIQTRHGIGITWTENNIFFAVQVR